MTPKTLQGRMGEDLACRYLQDRGLVLVERNYHCRCGELDLVMRDSDQLVFVEVRYRRSHRYGLPAETITKSKQMRLIRTAARYLQHRRYRSSCRFDVIAISPTHGENVLQWIKDAFQPS